MTKATPMKLAEPFNDGQIKALQAKLDKTHVSTRSQAGRELSYIEGWHAIAEANRIFGFDGWSRETVSMEICGEPQQVNGTWRVRYVAKVRIQAGGVFRDGTGYGSGISKDLGDAYEGAVKEAETDAMKRALMTFGNPFGLALYDKTQANVDAGPERMSAAQAKREGYADRIKEMFEQAPSVEDLDALWEQVKEDYLPILPRSWEDSIRDLYENTRDSIKEKTA